MYIIFLTLRYLTRKKIVLFPILVVWLCVMMLIIVTSIMGGFVERVRSANRDLFGDIIISSASSSQGFSGYEDLSQAIRTQFREEVEATTPVVEAYSLVYVPFAQRSVPALLVGVKPDERSRVSQFHQTLYQQYKMPEECLADLAPRLPAANLQLLDFAYAALGKALDEHWAARRHREAVESLTWQPGIAWARLGWLALPAAAAALLWIRARKRRNVLAYASPLVAGLVGSGLVILAAPWPVIFERDHELALDRLQRAALAADRAQRACDAAETLVTRGIHARIASGDVSRERAAEIVREFQSRTALRRQLMELESEIGDLKLRAARADAAGTRAQDSGTMPSRLQELQRIASELRRVDSESRGAYLELAGRYFTEHYASRAQLARALRPTAPDFVVPPDGGGSPERPSEGCIVGSQLGFFRRDTRGNFIHPYPFFYPHVTITVFPPSRSGTLNVRGTNAVTRDFTIVDNSHSGVYDVDSTNVYAPFETVQLMAGMRPDPALVALDPSADFEKRCHQVLIKLKPAALSKMRLVRARIEEFVELYAARHSGWLANELAVQTWDEKQARYLGAVQNEKRIMTFILLLMSGVVLVVIFLIFYQIVRDKTRDIGIIKAVGGSEAGVAAIFLSYGIMVGVVGGGLGVLTGTAFVMHTNEIHELIYQTTGLIIWDRSVYLFDRIPDVVNPWDCIIYFSVALAAGLLGAMIPAILAAFEDPVQAVRYE